MAEEKKRSLVPAISCHSWNKDGTRVALSPNNSEVHVYKTGGSENWHDWELESVLTEHSGYVSAVDWSHANGQIVTSGHDRNAYVWKEEGGEWKPTLVILRLNRAATSVKWSPDGMKFAVASGSKTVPVCHYEASNDWYISKMIRKHKSTINSVAWSPNSRLIVTGCCDGRVRIFSAFVKGLDGDSDDGYAAIFPNHQKFGELLWENNVGAWVNAVDWAAAGFEVAYAAHNATVGFVSLSGDAPAVQSITHEALPYVAIAYTSDSHLVAAGWSCNPASFEKGADGWAFKALLDKEVKAAKAPTASKFGAARALFAASASKGVAIDNSGAAAEETKLLTRHQNRITSVAMVGGGKVSTAGIDGNVFFWGV